MRVFNSIQIVGLFTGLPFLAGWLWTAEMQFAWVGSIIAWLFYVITFVVLVVSLAHSMHQTKDWW